MKKTAKRILALASAVLLVMSLFIVGAFAGGENGDCKGTTTTFDKYLTMKEEANVPNVEFEYEITAGTAKAAVRENDVVIQPTVYAGDDANRVDGVPSITEEVAFGVGDETFDSVQSGDTVVLEEGFKYAKETITLDFTDVTFSQPGIYRYVITESGSNDGVTNDENLVRYCDVYVHQKETSDAHDLVIVGYSIHETDDVIYKTFETWEEFAASKEIEELKDNGFQNDYMTYNLKIQKVITGNQGWKNNYFTFTLKISNADAGTRYDVNLDNASKASNKESASGIQVDDAGNYFLVADENGECEYTFELSNKGGKKEFIEVYGLTANTEYFVEEDRQDYEASWVIKNESEISNPDNCTYKFDDAYAMGESDNEVVFTNARVGLVPTAYMVEIAPYAAVALIAVAGALILAANKRKEKVTE